MASAAVAVASVAVALTAATAVLVETTIEYYFL